MTGTINPRLLRMAIAAGAGSNELAQEALDTANDAHDTAIVATSTADTAQDTADSAALTAVNAASTAALKEQFINRLIDNPGYIVLTPSGLIIEWGFSTVAGGGGEAVVTYQKLTVGHFPYSLVAMISNAPATNVMYSAHIDRLVLTGPNVTHVVAVRKQTGATTSVAPNGIIIQWIAIGY